MQLYRFKLLMRGKGIKFDKHGETTSSLSELDTKYILTVAKLFGLDAKADLDDLDNPGSRFIHIKEMEER